MIRVGYLYGTVNEDKSVKVEVIYEPPQDNTDISFAILEDPNQVLPQWLWFELT
jgi:hypothetical protein